MSTTQELIERLKAMSYAEMDELTHIGNRYREAEEDGGFENKALLYELEEDSRQARDREQFFIEAADRLASLSAENASLKDEVERLRAQDWQPIETAPKDGTRILAYPVTFMEAGVVSWHADQPKRPHLQTVSDIAHGTAAYWRVLLTADKAPYRPTHWRPLPAPPSSAALGGGG